MRRYNRDGKMLNGSRVKCNTQFGYSSRLGRCNGQHECNMDEIMP